MTIGEGALFACVRPRARQAQRFGAHVPARAGLLCLLAVALLVLLGIWPVPGPGTGGTPWPMAVPRGLVSVPTAAEGPVSAALGRDEAGYRVAGLRARNPAQQLDLAFSERGVMVASGAARVRLSLAGVGYAGAVRPVAAVSPVVASNRVSYSRGGVREWYANGPLGLEHGFDVAARPAAGTGPLTLSVALAGDLHARLDHGSVLLTGRGAHLRYGGLVATDGSGRRLRAALALRAGGLVVRVWDRAARYPLRIDPLFQNAKLTPADQSGDAGFGGSVAVSADGNTALIGGTSDNNNVGAAWVFTRSGSTWSQQGPKLTASDETGAGRFGSSVALSADGNTALIGGASDNNNVGAAWVVTRSGSTWSQQGPKLTGSTATGGQLPLMPSFGYSVALSADGNTAVIGAPFEGNGPLTYGAAWVFTRSGSTWTQQGPKLTATDQTPSTRFGWSVALSTDGNTALIGDPFDKDNRPLMSGAARVFTRSGSTWTQQGPKLTATDETLSARFGWSVALSRDGNTALIGGTSDNNNMGAVWVFTRSGSTWNQQGAKLTASDETGAGQFGISVALSADGNAALIGGSPFDVSGSSAGSAWVFTRSGATWSQQGTRLTASDETGSSVVGASVALSADGNTALIGALGGGAAWVLAPSTIQCRTRLFDVRC
jgi:FG-GAP repeat